jgi:NRAMP (natural resistance-associated macrophage protein)-like metal ion transporter
MRSRCSRKEPESSVSDRPSDSGWRQYLRAIGPGLVTGASDDDPSGIATYAQAGAQFRYGTLWTVLISFPLMAATQEICDRTALTTGESLGKLARRRFSGGLRAVIGVLLVALLIANGLNIAADLMAIGQGMALLHAGPAPLWSALAGIGLIVLLINGSFALIARVFKWLCLSLLSYVAVLFAAHVSWSQVVRGMLGLQLSFSGSYWAIIVAILGTTLSPYLFFWQTAHRVEEMRAEGDSDRAETERLTEHHAQHAARRERRSRFDVFSGMFLSQLVMFAIIAATAATIGAQKGVSINSAADAAKALKPVAGGLSTLLFAVGFIGSGILAVPVLAGSASVGISGLLDKDWGYGRSPRQAPLFYTLVVAGTIGGTVLSIFYNDPIGLLVFVALVNGIAAAPFLVITMLISSDTTIMGEHRNGRLATTLGWTTVGLMSLCAVTGLWQAVTGG